MTTTLQSLPPRAFPKLPIRLFEDYAPGGALCAVAARLAAVRRATPGFRAWEWGVPGARRQNLETLEVVRAELIRLGLLKLPVVAAHAACGAAAERALEAARRLGATTVDDASACDESDRLGRYLFMQPHTT